jgi:hypothetical protein
MQVGKPNYSSSRGQKLLFFKLGMKPEQRKLVVRVAPPVKELAEERRLGVYIKQHFGYTLKINNNDIPKTFKCIERRKGANVMEECPECEENRLRKAQLEAKVAHLSAQTEPKLSPDEIKAMVKPLSAYLKSHNLDKKWNLYAKNQQGQWGYLQLGHKAYESFLTACQKAQENDIDACGMVDGLWFEFTRTGEDFNQLVDTCAPVQVPGATKGSFTVKLDTLTEADLKTIEALPSLLTLGTTLKYDQIKMLVSSGGEDTVVKSIFDSGRPSATGGETVEVPTSPAPRSVRVEPTSTSAMAVLDALNGGAPTAASGVVAPQQFDKAQLQAMLAALNTAPATPAAVQPVASAQTVTPAITRKLGLDVSAMLEEMNSDSE